MCVVMSFTHTHAHTHTYTHTRTRFSPLTFCWPDLRAHLVTQVNNNDKTKGSLRRVPELPGKKLWGKFDAAFVEERRKGLEEFLNRVAGHAICRLEPGFHRFLSEQDFNASTLSAWYVHAVFVFVLA